MSLYLYEYEKRNNDVHDGIREYCLCERINEEYLRTLIKKPNYFSIIMFALKSRVRNFAKNGRHIIGMYCPLFCQEYPQEVYYNISEMENRNEKEE